MADSIRSTCTVCGQEKEIHYSLRLRFEPKERKWFSCPVCDACRKLLIAEAKAAGQFVPFFSITASEKEAKRRNEGADLRYRLLEQFGKPLRQKAKPRGRKNPKKAKPPPKAAN